MADASPIKLSWTRMTHTGARATNQDALGDASSGTRACFVLADGAGGHSGGEVAAATVVRTMLTAFSAAPTAPLADHAQHALTAVSAAQSQHPDQGDMSATVAAVLIDCASAHAQWLHLGDSRIYLFRQARLLAQTKDHSVTQQFIDAGLARADQLRQHAQRNMLFAAVGAHGDTAPSSSTHTLVPGDAILVCSDGLWEWVLEAQMEAMLAKADSSSAWLDAMCAIAEPANAASGKARDNYSAYAVFVEAA